MRKAMSVLLALGGLAVLAARADDPDPEPPGGANAELRKLKGTWTVTKAVFNKREIKAPPGLSYTFEGNKLTRTMPLGKLKVNVKGKGDNKQTYKVKIDTKKKPYKIEMTPDGGGKAMSGIFKIEKDELFLVTSRGKDGKAPEDFTGVTAPVMVMTKEKK
jgi:uncharacterized protein (TIGR03067 family)